MFEGNVGTSTLLKEIFIMGWKKNSGSPMGFLLIFPENHPPTALGGTLLPEDVEKASPAQGAAKLG